VGYSKTFTPKRYEPIAKVLEAVQRLEPGERLIVSEAPGVEIGLVRYLVYDFLFHTGLKERFRLKTLGTELLIQRLGTGEGLKVELQKSNQEFIETLIELWGSTDAEEALKGWVLSGKISAEDGDELWASVERIMA